MSFSIVSQHPRKFYLSRTDGRASAESSKKCGRARALDELALHCAALKEARVRSLPFFLPKSNVGVVRGNVLAKKFAYFRNRMICCEQCREEV